MNTTFQIAGIVFVAAAIIGGGLEAFGVKVPLMHSVRRQMMLALFGGLLLISAGVKGHWSKEDSGAAATPRTLPPNLDGTTWEGTLTYSSNKAHVPLRIVFGHDSSVLVIRTNPDVGPPNLGRISTDHCTWTAPNGIVRMDCAYYTIAPGNPSPITEDIAKVYVVSVNGSAMSGSVDEPSDPFQKGSVRLVKRE
jgi:hypothetical protein